MSVVDRLSVIYELQDRRYQDGLRRMLGASRRTNDDIIRQAGRAERGVSGYFSNIGKSAVAAAAKVAALGAALGKLTANSQSYKVIENRLRSLGEYSDDAAERLAASAIRSRSAFEETSTAVARIQKATGDGFDLTIRRVETLNKLLAVGGATAQEVSSVMTQLSQALTSGSLQGDELRSLREAAPVELLDAIAEAAGVTRGELKKMGEEGSLTSDIIVRALDSLASTADERFGRTTQTIGQAMTNLNTGLTMFAGRLDEGMGATSALSDALAQMGEWMASNGDMAEELGISIAAAMQTGTEVTEQIVEALNALAATLHDELVGGTILDLGEAFEESGMITAEVIDAIINAIADMNGTIEGAAAAIKEAFLQIPDAISAAMQGAINAVIGGVEAMVNRVLEGVRAVAAAVDIIPGVSISEGISNVSFGRVEGLATSHSTRSVGDAYSSGFDKGRGAVLDAVESVTGFFEGVGETYERNRAELKRQSESDDLTPEGVLPPPPSARGAASGSGSKKKGGAKKGRKEREERPFFEAVERDLVNLERQMHLIGKTAEEAATLEARWAMLDEAKKRGIPVNETLNAQIDAQAAQVGKLTGELERAEIAQEQFEQAVDGIADAMAGALLAGESLREGLAQVFKQIASDILSSGIKNAITSQIGAGGGGGFFAGLGKMFGFASGGYTGSGGRYDPAGIVHKGEYVMSAPAVQRIGLPKLEALHRGGSVGDTAGGSVDVRVFMDEGGNWQAQVERISGKVAATAVATNNRARSDQQYLKGGR